LAVDYAPATAGSTIKQTRQFFKLAMRDKYMVENPFADVKASGQTNKERQFHIDRETTAKVIEKAPDHE
jgi:site-specific recombinase XerD